MQYPPFTPVFGNSLQGEFGIHCQVSCVHVCLQIESDSLLSISRTRHACTRRSVHLVEFHQAAQSLSSQQVHSRDALVFFVEHFVDCKEFSCFNLLISDWGQFIIKQLYWNTGMASWFMALILFIVERWWHW